MTSRKLPLRDRYSLPDALKYLRKKLNFERVDLVQALKKGSLRCHCYPYTTERQRKAEIHPEQWVQMWPNDWEFPVYCNYIGDTNLGETEPKIPLHIVPDEADEAVKFKGPGNQRLAESAEVYVMGEELVRFTEEYLFSASKPQKRQKKPGRKIGRPAGHDYSKIDQRLEAYQTHHGLEAFSRPSLVIDHLKERLGENALPSDSALRAHIARWRKRILSP